MTKCVHNTKEEDQVPSFTSSLCVIHNSPITRENNHSNRNISPGKNYISDKKIINAENIISTRIQ